MKNTREMIVDHSKIHSATTAAVLLLENRLEKIESLVRDQSTAEVIATNTNTIMNAIADIRDRLDKFDRITSRADDRTDALEADLNAVREDTHGRLEDHEKRLNEPSSFEEGLGRIGVVARLELTEMRAKGLEEKVKENNDRRLLAADKLTTRVYDLEQEMKDRPTAREIGQTAMLMFDNRLTAMEEKHGIKRTPFGTFQEHGPKTSHKHEPAGDADPPILRSGNLFQTLDGEVVELIYMSHWFPHHYPDTTRQRDDTLMMAFRAAKHGTKTP
jgi:hypothetical protein